ncbi:MAG: carboxymuconolactone decarboxylase family protein [Candidatus Dormibacteraceae bacterium]
MTHLYDSHDLRHLQDLRAPAPQVLEAFAAFDAAALHREDARIPSKYRELIALGVPLTTPCVFCIEAHTKAAKKAGADQTEPAEAVGIAMALRAGGSLTQGAEAAKVFSGDES